MGAEPDECERCLPELRRGNFIGRVADCEDQRHGYGKLPYFG